MKNKHKKAIRVFALILFGVYMVALVYFLFFSEHLGRTPSDTYKYSLQPFREIRRYIYYKNQIGTLNVVLNLLGNIICFMPFGFVLPILSRAHRGIVHVTALTMLTSVLVELIQLVTKVGSCDVDDVILNTLGGFLGYICFFTANHIFHWLDSKTTIKSSEK